MKTFINLVRIYHRAGSSLPVSVEVALKTMRIIK